MRHYIYIDEQGNMASSDVEGSLMITVKGMEVYETDKETAKAVREKKIDNKDTIVEKLKKMDNKGRNKKD